MLNPTLRIWRFCERVVADTPGEMVRLGGERESFLLSNGSFSSVSYTDRIKDTAPPRVLSHRMPSLITSRRVLALEPEFSYLEHRNRVHLRPRIASQTSRRQSRIRFTRKY